MYIALFAEDNINDRILKDDAMIIPGRGAEKILLYEDINIVIERYGKFKFKYSKPEKISELFKDIFKIDGKIHIYFDGIYYNDEKKFTVFVFQRKIIAIAGFNMNRTTGESVQFGKGVDNFIFSYDNMGLTIMENAGNKIYIYPDRGLAIVDDDSNDSIDMYLVFTSSPKRQK